MFTPKIIALDLDGTLFTRDGVISPYTKKQIRSAVDKGIVVVLSTGRPYVGLPVEEATELGIRYAITTNGAAIYELPNKQCLYEEGITPSVASALFSELIQKPLHLDAFIQGDAYAHAPTLEMVRHCSFPESVIHYILATRIRVENLASYIFEHQLTLQKATLNFQPTPEGTFIGREETKEFLLKQKEIHVVSGGYHNLEFTKAGVTKAKGLQFLCDYLQIPIESSMVCGDSENDLDILKVAGLSVAMANAEDDVKNLCDYVTTSCNEDGVGHAISKFI